MYSTYKPFLKSNALLHFLYWEWQKLLQILLLFYYILVVSSGKYLIFAFKDLL